MSDDGKAMASSAAPLMLMASTQSTQSARSNLSKLSNADSKVIPVRVKSVLEAALTKSGSQASLVVDLDNARELDLTPYTVPRTLPSQNTANTYALQRYLIMQEKVYCFFIKPQSGWPFYYQVAIILLLVIETIMAMYITVPPMNDTKHTMKTVVLAIDIILMAIVLLEVVLKFWSCTCKPYYRNPTRILGRLKFFLKFWTIIDCITLALAATALSVKFLDNGQAQAAGQGLVAVFRAFRMLNLVKILQIERDVNTLDIFLSIWKTHKLNFLVAYIFAFILITISGFLIYFIEGGPDKHYESVLDGCWWAVVTCATIGYGDYFPETFWGRAVGVYLATVGIAVYAIPAGLLSSAFALKVENLPAEREKEFEAMEMAAVVIGKWWQMRAAQARSDVFMNMITNKAKAKDTPGTGVPAIVSEVTPSRIYLYIFFQALLYMRWCRKLHKLLTDQGPGTNDVIEVTQSILVTSRDSNTRVVNIEQQALQFGETGKKVSDIQARITKIEAAQAEMQRTLTAILSLLQQQRGDRPTSAPLPRVPTDPPVSALTPAPAPASGSSLSPTPPATHTHTHPLGHIPAPPVNPTLQPPRSPDFDGHD